MALLLTPTSAFTRDGDTLSIRFVPLFHGTPLSAAEGHSLFSSGDTFSIDQLRFYCTNICLKEDENIIWKDATKYHLIDVSDTASLVVHIGTKWKAKIRLLKFHLGIDSATNVSGVLGGDLDPAKGMYWSWQSGYINLKIEGKNVNCEGGKYRLHLGGYSGSHSAIQGVTIRMSKFKNEVRVGIETSILIEKALHQQKCIVMIPGRDAVLLSEIASQMFIPIE